MREIKFRAWNPKEANPHMFYFDLELIRDDENEANWQNMGCVMQYTGLKDKNGKEIYEGDVVRVYEIVGDGAESTWVNEVCFRHGCFCLVNKSCCKHCRDGFGITCILSESMYLGNGVEIIGNIYENPELCE